MFNKTKYIEFKFDVKLPDRIDTMTVLIPEGSFYLAQNHTLNNYTVVMLDTNVGWSISKTEYERLSNLLSVKR